MAWVVLSRESKTYEQESFGDNRKQ